MTTMVEPGYSDVRSEFVALLSAARIASPAVSMLS